MEYKSGIICFLSIRNLLKVNFLKCKKYCTKCPVIEITGRLFVSVVLSLKTIRSLFLICCLFNLVNQLYVVFNLHLSMYSLKIFSLILIG